MNDFKKHFDRMVRNEDSLIEDVMMGDDDDYYGYSEGPHYMPVVEVAFEREEKQEENTSASGMGKWGLGFEGDDEDDDIGLF